MNRCKNCGHCDTHTMPDDATYPCLLWDDTMVRLDDEACGEFVESEDDDDEED